MPRTLFTGIATLALAMTGCFIVFASGAKQSPGRVAKKIRHSERSEESHRRTDGYMYFFTLVVGYFAIAQYDVRTPIVGFADTSPEGGSEFCFIVFASVARQTLGRVNYRTAEFPCHRERKRGDPPEKVRGIYSVLNSKGLPRHSVPRNDK